MENKLIKNLDKIHTTELGNLRIRKNLNLDIKDTVIWCIKIIKKADKIIKKGKNWYVHFKNLVITINANSYTIITAYKIKNMEL